MAKDKKVSFKESGYFFDNCPICQGMAKAEENGEELSGDNLAELFAEANSEQAKK